MALRHRSILESLDIKAVDLALSYLVEIEWVYARLLTMCQLFTVRPLAARTTGVGRVERLHAWCAAPEQSGIRALEEFAAWLCD